MSTLKLRAVIQELNRVNLDVVAMDHLVSRFWAASRGTTAPIGGSAAELYFRARKCNTRPTSAAELGAPPADKVVGFQRCNPPNQPMFYAASKRITALLESRVQAGDIVYLSHWVGAEAMRVNRILHSPLLDDTPLNHMFYAFIETIFSKRIHADFSTDYKLTAAATKVFTTEVRSSEDSTTEQTGKVGLAYPSVANKFDGYNTVFHADVAQRLLRCLHVTELRIAGIDEATGEVSVEFLDNANVVTEDGCIVWMGDPHAIPAALGSNRDFLLMRSNGTTWSLPMNSGQTTAYDVERFLHE